MNESMHAMADEKLVKEGERLARSSRLHWFHWAIIALSLALTIFIANHFKNQVDSRAEAQFERESSRVVEQIAERLRKYEDALWSGAAAIRSHGGAVSRSEWQTFSEHLRIEQVYPGINGIGVIEHVSLKDLPGYIENQISSRGAFSVHPAHNNPESLPIVYIEPEAPNQAALGLDMAHEENRYEAAVKARNSGLAQITGPIFLVQDEARTPGFLFYAPYYRDDTLPTPYSRRKGFIGMVYAPFVVQRLIAGTLERDKRNVGIRISDGPQPIYDSEQSSELSPRYFGRKSIELYGRTWDIDTWSTKEFRSVTENRQPLFVLIAGVAIDSLLLALFLRQSRASRKTLDYADRLTAEIRNQTLALEKVNSDLEKSNADLESFAYVASHDLKTPLRGMRDLTSYIEEDLLDYMKSPEANPSVEQNIKRLFKQSKRMDSLIHGILEYSSIDGDESVGEVNLRQVANTVAMDLNVRFDQISFNDLNPVLYTYEVRFQQVLANILSNAFKFHPEIDKAQVEITSKDSGSFYEISVSDNGNGIEPEYYDRIFEPFQTLQSKDEIESTGVGLAIVKRSVESVGGQVWVKSEGGKGSTFTFLWPKAALADYEYERRRA